jgi:hypothetical protein
MADEHRNIFFYYRGQVRSDAGEEAELLREQQAEDNTTKALVNLLEWSHDWLTRSFVESVLEFPLAKAAAGTQPSEYFLQGGPENTPTERWLLAISQSSADLNPSFEKGSGGSRVDGGFVLSGEILVLFEVKLGVDRDEAQLARHRDRWAIPVEKTLPVSWASVHEWAGHAFKGTDEPLTRFLLSQFLEYLSLCRLKPFGGLEHRDFAFFDAPTWEQQPEVKAQLGALWDQVYARLPVKGRDALGDVHVGQLGLADHAWAQTHKEQRVVNLTLEVSSKELQLNLVAWLERPAQQMLNWLRSPAAMALSEFDGYDLVLFQRRAGNYGRRDETRHAWWQREESDEVGHLLIGADATTDLLYLLAPIDGWDSPWEKPACHLRRSWSRAVAVDAKLDLVPEISSEVEALLPLLKTLNAEG